MSEVNGKTLSISFRIDEGVIEHNNRIFIAKNVDGERVQDNITYCRQDIREKYDELFGQALAEYNARQKQASRRIPDYYEHLKKSSKADDLKRSIDEKNEKVKSLTAEIPTLKSVISQLNFLFKLCQAPRSCCGFGVANFLCS